MTEIILCFCPKCLNCRQEKRKHSSSPKVHAKFYSNVLLASERNKTNDIFIYLFIRNKPLLHMKRTSFLDLCGQLNGDKETTHSLFALSAAAGMANSSVHLQLQLEARVKCQVPKAWWWPQYWKHKFLIQVFKWSITYKIKQSLCLISLIHKLTLLGIRRMH